jgi:hypothetical protein
LTGRNILCVCRAVVVGVEDGTRASGVDGKKARHLGAAGDRFPLLVDEAIGFPLGESIRVAEIPLSDAAAGARDV